MTQETVEKVVIFFAGDSGDGIQLAGSQFTNTAALYGNDLSTFPDFPAEIRAPQGTLAGVSGFQISFGSTEIFTPGDECDVLVVMNVAALKANLKRLKKGGAIIVNTDGFDKRNLRLAGFEDGENPLSDNSLSDYRVSEMNVTKLKEADMPSMPSEKFIEFITPTIANTLTIKEKIPKCSISSETRFPKFSINTSPNITAIKATRI